MKAPKIYYEQKWVEEIGKALIDAKWTGLTLPTGIYFVEKKKNIKEKQYKHEFWHWKHFQESFQGRPFVYIAAYATCYTMHGYEECGYEKAANDNQDKPLTKEERSWIV
jgi:hypothetical protein